MIHAVRTGNFGDHLFQICFAKVIATRFRYRLRTAPVVGFNDERLETAGDNFITPTVTWAGQWPFDAQTGRRLSRNELYEAPNRRVILQGFFQRFEFYAADWEEIKRSWISLPESAREAPKDFIICRSGLDSPYEALFPSSEKWLSMEETVRLARTVRYRKLYLLANKNDRNALDLASQLNAQLVCQMNEATAVSLIATFGKIAFCQNSSFWWAAALSKAHEIYFPHMERGPWAHPAPALLLHEPPHWGIDLRMLDERYIYDW
jgi:hypothetical protein